MKTKVGQQNQDNSPIGNLSVSGSCFALKA